MRHALSIAMLSMKNLSIGVWIIASLFVLSGVVLLLTVQPRSDDMQMWVFSPEHEAMYKPMLERMNSERAQQSAMVAMDDAFDEQIQIKLSILSRAAIKSRMMSGFFGGLETADLIEVERATVGQVFMGPIEAVGFHDLTDRLIDEGLYDQINKPSLSPWTMDGRVFGLPHDVHPVMLAYRADLVEAAGIDLQQATTWDEMFAMLAPLMTDTDGNGQPDRYPLSFWFTQPDNVELLLLQGGGQLFANDGTPTINTEINAQLLAKMVSWCVGPNQVATDIDEFSAGGHQSRVDGDAIAYLAPDWMCSIWKMHVPGIAGKMKVMPLPAFQPGGLRTSVRGGTMLGIPKATKHFEQSWEAAKLLYTSPEVARELYRMVDIVTPIRSLWDDPVFDEPDPFFMNQPKGRMYIELAPDIPLRPSSPYNTNAVLLIRDAAVNLSSWARDNELYEPEQLLERAKQELIKAQRGIERQMERNVFAPGDGE